MKKIAGWFRNRENKWLLLAISPIIVIGGTLVFTFAAKAGILWWTIRFTAVLTVAAILFSKWFSWCLKKAFPEK